MWINLNKIKLFIEFFKNYLNTLIFPIGYAILSLISIISVSIVYISESVYDVISELLLFQVIVLFNSEMRNKYS
jgi:hypothetical protein